jgi:hypothetical protein
MFGDKGKPIKGRRAVRDRSTGAVVYDNNKAIQNRQRKINRYKAINKISTLERQIRLLESRLEQLENA